MFAVKMYIVRMDSLTEYRQKRANYYVMSAQKKVRKIIDSCPLMD